MKAASLRHLAPVTAILLGLAACGEQQEPAETTAGDASGEVLEGSISDAMIPLEQLRSSPPIEVPVERSQGGASAAPAEDEPAGEEVAPEPSSAAATETVPEPAAAD